MKRILSSLLLLGVFSLPLLGCSRASFLPSHAEVLVYPLPLDIVYLRTLDAVQAHPEWELEETDKEKGVIVLRNMRYSSFADADMRTATLLVKRVGPKESSIQLDPKSVAVVGGDEILSIVKVYLSREVGIRQGK
ncbi:MAG: hypothetical protein HY447_04350 [Candidatus Omnitrophica bacterium]|nr:hypothetical protein [Candidatus Omnitrophota bacterium]